MLRISTHRRSPKAVPSTASARATSAAATFAGQLTEQVGDLAPLIGVERQEDIEYARSPDPAQSPQLTDLGLFVSEIGVQSLQASDAADAVLRAIGDVAVHQTVGPARLGSTGMSIYFPATPDLADPRYAETTDVVAWQQFADAYLSLEFDDEAGVANASVPFDYTDPATGEVQPVDLSLVLDVETALLADLPTLQYDVAPLEAGTELYVDITVTDFGGNEVIGAATFIQE